MSENNNKTDEAAVVELIENWARAVRAKDYDGILASHSEDIVMFDVPPPFESKGIEAYKQTWDLFFSAAPDPVAFDIERMDIFAGDDVAFAACLMRCAEKAENGEWVRLDFRLTVGLSKIDGDWTIVHEHHSVPAT
jgi:uncharacterized protein (TIGR02246 family)